MIGSHYGFDLCEDGYTFCSKVVTDVLLSCGLLNNDINSSQTSPSSLAKMICKEYDQALCWSIFNQSNSIRQSCPFFLNVHRDQDMPVVQSHAVIDWGDVNSGKEISFRFGV
jgi:hypothetical protein